MILLNIIKKYFYKFRRVGSSFFTYDCVCCGKAVRGKCLCDDCEKNVIPAVNRESGKAAAYIYETRRFELKTMECLSPRMSFTVLCFIAVLFIVFTFNAPEINIFKDHLATS